MKLIRLLWLTLLATLMFAGASVWFLLQSETASTATVALLDEITDGAIRAGSAQGPLKGPLTVENFVYEDRYVRVEVARARLDWSPSSLLRRQLRVHRLDSGTVRLTLKPTPPNPDPKPVLTRLPFALVVEQAQVESFSLVVGDAAPVVFEDIALSADWTRDDIHVSALRTHYAPVGTLDLKGTLQMQPRALAVQDLLVRGLGEIKANGLIGYDSRVQAELSWNRLRWPQADEPLLFSPRGRANIDGRWQDFAYRLQADAELSPLSAQVDSAGRGSVRGLDLQTLKLHTLGGTVSASGELRWAPAVTIKGQGEFSGLNPQALAPEWPGLLNGEFAGGLDALTPLGGHLKLTLGRSQLRGWPLTLSAEARAQGEVLTLKNFDLRSGGSELSAQGPLRPRLDAELDLVSANLGELWPGLAGSARARLHVRGTRAQPHVIADAQVQQLKYGPLAVSDAELQVDLSAGAASRFRLELRDSRIGVPVERITLTGEGNTARNRFVLEARSAVGTIDMNFTGALDLRALRWQGQLTRGHGEPLRLSPWTLEEPAALGFGLQNFELAPACWRSANGRACVHSNIGTAQLRTAFRVEQLAFAYFEPLMPSGWKMTGEVSGTVRVVQERKRLQAQADLQTSAGQISIGGSEALRFAPSRWLAEETERGFVSRLELPVEDAGGQGGLFWDALLSPAADWTQRRWSGELRADLSSLQPLRLLSPELESVNGALHGRFAVSGSAGAPRLDGAMRLRDGRLRLATPGIELTGLSADLFADARSSELRFEAQALSGGGALRVAGTADAGSFGDSVALEVSGENFQAAATAQARVWVSPQLQFKLHKRRADLTGEVAVPRAEITLKRIDQGVGASSDQVIVDADGAASEAGLLKIYSNVRIRLGEDVSFEGLGLSTQLAGALQAFDEPGRPTMARGEVRLLGGRYTAYGQDLNIETGRLIFGGGPITQPAVELRAQRKPSDEVTVGLYVRGQLDAPEFSLFSTPAMTQEQQLAWLVLGRPLQQESSTGAERNALSGAALSLGLSGGNFLAKKLGAGLLPVDEISIGARPGQSSEKAQLTFGKYLSPKLFVSYGIGLFQPGQAFRLLYDIGYGFKLSTESGVESGGDLVYTIEK